MNARTAAGWWTTGAAVGALVLGPGLQPGSLLSLDLVLTPQLTLPSAVWGLGPELPQRVPLGVPLAWLSTVVGGPNAGKALLLLSFAAAFVGMARLTSGLSVPCRAGAGLLYAIGPFALTRAGAGHLNVLAAYALLPWVLPTLVRPRQWRTAFLAALVMALTGSAGGSLALLCLFVGLVADRDRDSLRSFAAGFFAQLVWLVPNAVALASGANVAGAQAFRTRIGLAMFAGGGFWRQSSEVGGDVALAAVGLGVFALAVVGHKHLPARWRGRAAALAIVGFSVALASAIPGIRSGFDAVTATALGSPFRESQRTLALYWVWAVPAAAAGAAHLARRLSPGLAAVTLAAVPAFALVAGTPGLWGIEGRLDPVEFPEDWSTARAMIDAQPGTVLALPWHEYLDLSFAGGRRVLNPLPSYLDNDVISSFDPEVGEAHQEQNDPRAEGIDELVGAVERGEAIAPDLAKRGVRWVVLAHEVDAPLYVGLDDDPGLELVAHGPALDLYEVRAWRGTVVDEHGAPVASSSPLRPWLRTSTSAPTLWSRPSQPGWLRGWQAAGAGAGGRLAIPAGTGPIWFWPTTLVVATDIAVAVLFVLVLRGRRRAPRRAVVAPIDPDCYRLRQDRQAKEPR